MFNKLSEFFLFSSIFIASCAVSFCMETNILLGLPLNTVSFYYFVFGATLVQYNLHYLVKTIAVKDSLRLAWSKRNRLLHFILLGIGILLIIISLFSFHFQHFMVLLCLAGIAFIYSFPVIPFGNKRRIKEYGLLKIITLSFLWTLVTVWFPVNNMLYDSALFLFVFVKRFVFMFVLCLLFDVRDIEIDRKNRINTFPVIYGRKKSYLLSYLLLLLFIILSVFQYFYLPQTGFLTAMVLSAAATFFIIEATKKTNSDFIYLAGIDGMMLLQALLIYLFSLNL